jgi:S-(hydroxymethyl)glutathione dehydrogenase/alcohol dehydrogenase
VPLAAVVHDKNRPMQIESVTLRGLRADEVRVRVRACGVCHSDVSVLNQLFACPTPVVLGHEASGVVEEVGSSVTAVTRGDHVVACWSPSCGRCRYCRRGKLHLCRLTDDPTSAAMDRITLGSTPVAQFLGVGGFAEEIILSENALVRIDRSFPLDRASLLGCAVLTGFGAVEKAARVRAGDEVAVFGCGGVGLNVIQTARRLGAATVVAIDLDDRKLEMARRFGATHTLRGDAPELSKEIRALTLEKQGVDFAFDAVGNVEIARVAFQSVCKGGEVILVGIAHAKDKLSLSQIVAVTQEKTIRGTTQGSLDAWSALPRLVELYNKGELLLDELVTAEYSLDRVNDAIADLRSGRNARGLVVFN